MTQPPSFVKYFSIPIVIMSQADLSPADQHIVQGAYNHYRREFDRALANIDTERLVAISRGQDSACDGCHDDRGNQEACFVENAGVFGCQGHDVIFNYPDEQELPGIDTLKEASDSSDQKERHHAERVLQAIEAAFTRAREETINSLPTFLRERRGYNTGMQTLQGKALDQVVDGAGGLRAEQAVDQHRSIRQQPPGLQNILASSHNIPSWTPMDKGYMVRELGEIGVEFSQNTPVETIADAFIHHHDQLVVELVKNGHKERDLKYESLAGLQTQLSENSRKTRRTGGTRRNKRGKKKSMRRGVRHKTRVQRHKRKRQTRDHKKQH